jgi:hypothetical protein
LYIVANGAQFDVMRHLCRSKLQQQARSCYEAWVHLTMIRLMLRRLARF